MDRKVADLDDALDELVNSSFLYTFQWVDQGYFDFRHQLLRDALYDTVPAAELRRLHARAAEFGPMIGANEIHQSVHFERAGLRTHAPSGAKRAPSPRVRCPAAMRRSSSTAGRSPTPRTTCRRRSSARPARGVPGEAAFAVDDVLAAIEHGATGPRGVASWKPAGSSMPRGPQSRQPGRHGAP